jgi:protein TonB
MRKVYQNSNSFTTFAASVAVAAGLTGVLFGILPFSHLVAKPGKKLELRKATSAELPPPVEESAPPPPNETEPPPPADQPEPQLSDAPQQIPVTADLETAMGGGGALAGLGETIRAATAESVQTDTFDVTELEKRPEPLSQVPPVYPAELRRAKVEGSVTLVFVLNEEGRVEDPRVESSSRPEFEKPALDAIRRWKFRPGMKDGKAVSTYMRLPMRFNVAGGA